MKDAIDNGADAVTIIVSEISSATELIKKAREMASATSIVVRAP